MNSLPGFEATTPLIWSEAAPPLCFTLAVLSDILIKHRTMNMQKIKTNIDNCPGDIETILIQAFLSN